MTDILLDTSFTHLRVALARDGKIIASLDKSAFMRQSEEMIPTLSRLMEETKTERSDVDSVIVARGPGSYTGVRIAMTAAKVMALALNRPLYLVSSLAILREGKKKTAIMMDARAKRSYFAVYEGTRALVEDCIKSNDEVMAYLKEHPDCLIGGEPAYLGLEVTAKPDVFLNMLSAKDGEPADTLKAAPAYLRGPLR